jgi:hypothetical protein
MDQAPTHEEGPLSAEQRQELARASEQARKLMGAAKVAAFNAWTFAIFAGLSILFGLVGRSFVGLVVGVALAVIARNEFHGRSMLLDYRPGGPRLLARNALWLMGLIILYCLWAIHSARTAPNPSYAQLEEAAGFDQGYITRLTVFGYGAVIVLSAILQGLLSRYYNRRATMLDQYLAETPAWVVEIQRNT